MSKIVLVSRCAWSLYNFRRGQMGALRGSGHDVVGAAGPRGDYERKLADMGFAFESLPFSGRPVNPAADVRLLWRLFRLYRQQRPDVVHQFTIKPVVYGSIAGRLAGVPRIVNTVTGLGIAFSSDGNRLLRFVAECLYRVALACANFTFFQNEEDRRLFIERGLVRPEKTGLLPGSGVDTELFTPSWPEPAPHTGEPITFLMVARILRDKGVYEFAEAARIVRAEYPDAMFHIVGRRDGDHPAAVPQRDLDRWEAEGTVQWLGEVEDVREVVCQADVVVLPSYYREGTPRSLLEAAAMGKPLITTDSVGCREVVDDGINGFLVPVKNSRALAEAMRRMIANPEMRLSMGQAGRAKMVREFDEAIVIQRIINVYQRL